MIKRFSLCCICCILLLSCCRMNTIHGNRIIITERLVLSDYDHIRLSGSIGLVYHQDAAQQAKLQITTDQNIYEALNIYVKDRTLYIEPDKTKRLSPSTIDIRTHSAGLCGLKSSGSAHILISDTLETEHLRINISGSGKISTEHSLFAQQLTLHSSGSCDVFLSGNIKDASFNLSGAGKINALKCNIENADCQFSGSANAKLNVSKNLNYAISGSGNIRYKGHPKLRGHISGSGQVREIE